MASYGEKYLHRKKFMTTTPVALTFFCEVLRRNFASHPSKATVYERGKLILLDHVCPVLEGEKENLHSFRGMSD